MKSASRCGTILAGLLVWGTLSGCGLLLSADDEQCNSDADCAARGFDGAVCESQVCVAGSQENPTGSTSALTSSSGSTADPSATSSTGGEGTAGTSSTGTVDDGPWGCVGNVVWDEEDEAVPARLGLHFTDSQFQDFEGASLNACRPLDLDCEEPLSTAVSGADGVAFIDVYYGFDGYFRAPPPAETPDVFPFILYSSPPPFSLEEESRGGDVLFIDPATIGALAALSGVELVPDSGLIFFTAFDCDDELAADVTVSVSPVGTDTVVAYLDGAFPNADLTATVDVGQGAVLNVPPGLVEVTGTSLERGRFFQSTVLVEANSVTGLAIVPMPL
ncbi:MAG: hypothetical protein ACRBN8_14960 [Nannocystales bacterium]